MLHSMAISGNIWPECEPQFGRFLAKPLVPIQCLKEGLFFPHRFQIYGVDRIGAQIRLPESTVPLYYFSTLPI